MTLTIALCAVCYFYRGDIYATCSHLIHAPLDMIHAQPNILIIRTDIARRQEAGQGRGKRGEVCCCKAAAPFGGRYAQLAPTWRAICILSRTDPIINLCQLNLTQNAQKETRTETNILS